MKTVAACNSLDEALLLKSLLEGSGIAAIVPDEHAAHIAPPYVLIGGGVRVQVPDEDEEDARRIIADAQS